MSILLYLFGHTFAILSYMEPKEITKPHLIVMVGIPGAGKSFFAEHFADTFKAPIVSFDRLRKEIFSDPAFSKNEDKIIEKVANHILTEVLKTKRTVIYEGQTNLRTDRMAISKLAHDAGYEALFIWVQTEISAAKKRVIKTKANKSATNEDDFENKVKRFTPPGKTEKAIVISGKHTYASQLKIVLKHLIQPQTNNSERASLKRPPKSRNYLIR